ncbi:MAG: translation initiation factor IF-2 [Gemmatimonadota bacterium]
MRVYEVAREFKIDPEKLTQLLRSMGVAIRSEATAVDDATVAKLRARFERERRAGHDEAEAIDTVIEDAQPTKRRRRRKEDLPPAPEPVAEAEAEPVAEPVAKTDIFTGPLAEKPKLEDLFPEKPEPIEAPAAEAGAEAPTEEGPAAPAKREITAEQKPKLRRAAEVLGWTQPRQPPPPPQRAVQQRQDRPARPQRPTEQRPAASAGPGGHVRIQAEGFTSDGRKATQGAKPAVGAGGKPDKKKKKQRKVDQEEVQENINRVLAELKGGGKKKKHRREEAPSRVEMEAERQRRAVEEAETVRVNEFLTVAEIAELIDHSPTEIIGSAFKNLGLMVTINQRLDFDQIELLLDEFGFRAVRETEYTSEAADSAVEEDKPEDLKPRPPIVTVMGHVDHGKTSLLDYVRKTNVIAGESGGITQHIGAYHVKLEDGRSITVLDTPGHAAVTAMRARGAEVTDIVILVVAADDSVMPQTVEAISHAKNAGVPMIVAINKVDLPAANPSKVKQELLQHGVVVEDFGGDVLSAEVSAKKGNGISDLLDKVLLQAEVLDRKANPDRPANGIVVEALLDIGKGPVATVLVTNGTLRVGDAFVCGHYDGRVRALLDERGKTVKEAGPGVPVQVLGMPGVPQAGDVLLVMDAVKAAEIAQTRHRLEREKQLRVKSRGVKLTDISKLLAQGQTAYLNLIIKGDVDGSVQALSDALGQLSTNEVQVDVIHRGVGAINESDVLLAASSGSIIIGFHVRPTAEARATAAREGVDIRQYNIIYEAIEEVRSALEGMLAPEEREVLVGVAEVRQLFKVPKFGTVAGCMVTEGVIDRKSQVRVVRDGVQVYLGGLSSLRRFKDDVKEVREGFECGMSVEGYNDLKIGDHIETFKVESVARSLAASAQE